MAPRWTNHALDAELARRVAAQARIADALVELERHPGHRLLAATALTGTSARRWATSASCSPGSGPISPPTGRRSPPRAPPVPGGPGRARASGRSCTGCSSSRRSRWTARPSRCATVGSTGRPWRSARPRSANSPSGWTRGSARSSPCWRRPRVCTSPRSPCWARSRSGCARPGHGQPRCWIPRTPTPPRSPTSPRPSTSGSRPARTIHSPTPAGRRATSRATSPTTSTARSPPSSALAALSAVCDAWPQRRAEVAAAVGALDDLSLREGAARRDALRGRRRHRPCRAPRPAARAAPAARGAARSSCTGRGPTALAALPRLAADAADAAAALRAATERATGLTDRRRELARAFRRVPGQGRAAGGGRRPGGRGPWTSGCGALLDDGPADLRALTPALVAYQQRIGAAGSAEAAGGGVTDRAGRSR